MKVTKDIIWGAATYFAVMSMLFPYAAIINKFGYFPISFIWVVPLTLVCLIVIFFVSIHVSNKFNLNE
jgi:hypothetical protein